MKKYHQSIDLAATHQSFPTRPAQARVARRKHVFRTNQTASVWCAAVRIACVSGLRR